MIHVVKRLELISAAIYLQENQIIISQAKKLQNFPLDNEAKIIYELLLKGLYDESLPKIKNYIKKFSDIKAYEDPRIKKAKDEVKTLEQELCNLSFKKYETILKLYSFNKRYYEILGDSIKDILKLQLDIATQALSKQQIKKEEFDKTEERYINFINLYTKLQAIKQNSLLDDEKEELTRIYKKAIMSIHPSIVVDEHKDDAKELFDKLNSSFIQKDFNQIQILTNTLKKDAISTYNFDKIEDTKKLKKQSKNLMESINNLENELQEFRKNSFFSIIESKESLEHFFTQTQRELLEKKSKLKESQSLNN